MTANRRIFLNIVATYGRSVYALILGLFAARWVLQALGTVDYGLYGVIGGLTGFIGFFNGLLATAVGRFYAINIGKASVSDDKAKSLESCRAWFSTAAFVHFAIPSLLMAVGYPTGIWVVRNFLTIPADSILDCIWVFRFVCISCYISMVSVPINAMYMAKQYIAELTIYSFVTTTLHAAILCYMAKHPGVWLRQYSLWSCVLAIAPQVLICTRGHRIFPECRLLLRECLSVARFKELSYFVGWWAFGNLGGLVRTQGIQIVINKYYGPAANASMSVANSVNAHTMTLSGALLGAFQPAIVTACGAGDENRMKSLSFRACKFSMLFFLLFMIPLSLELGEILRLWLVKPPEFVYELCLMLFAVILVDQSSVGHMLAVNAKGKIAKYQLYLGSILISTLPIAWLLCAFGLGIYLSVGGALLVTMAFCAWGRVWFARSLVGMSARYWLFSVVAPTVFGMVAGFAAGSVPKLFWRPSPIRILATVLCCEVAFLPAVWFVVFDMSERAFFLNKAKSFLAKRKMKLFNR